MSVKKIHTFYVKGGIVGSQIAANVFINDLPRNATAIVHSIVEYGCDWFVMYFVISPYGQTEFFYELVQDSNHESSYYVLNISYNSNRAICSFDSREQIIFVDSKNNTLTDQNEPDFYEYAINENFKIFLVIFKDNILLFWNDDSAQVIVKTLDFSTFFEFSNDNSPYHFTRVNYEIDLTNEHCKITFYTDPLDTNIYRSAYVDIESFLESNNLSVVLKEHIVDQPSYSPFNGSQFTTDICTTIGMFTLEMSHIVDGQLPEADSDIGSDAGSDAGSEEDNY